MPEPTDAALVAALALAVDRAEGGGRRPAVRERRSSQVCAARTGMRAGWR